MNTTRTTDRRVEEEISNVRTPRQGHRVPPQEYVTMTGQVAVNPLAMRDGEVSSSLIQMSQVIATQA